MSPAGSATLSKGLLALVLVSVRVSTLSTTGTSPSGPVLKSAVETMTSQSGLFDNVMTDVSGKVRLESEDPRWIQLFSSKSIPLLTAEEVRWYSARLIEHNPATGNLIQLLDQTATKLQEVTSRRTQPPSQLTEQCCSALFLTSLLMHHIIAHSSLSELLRQLQLGESWAEQDHYSRAQHGHNQSQSSTSTLSGRVLEKLILELAAALDAPTSNTWMRDVKFFAAELLLCLCSTQLYASSTPSAQWPGTNSPSDLVLNFLYSRGEAQLREALGGGQTNSSAFSSCLAVQLVRGLVVTACAADVSGQLVAAPAVAVTQKASTQATASYKPTTALLTHLIERYRNHKPGSGGTAGGDGNSVGAAVQDILIEFLRLLPFGVLHRLFTHGPSPQQRAASVDSASRSSAPPQVSPPPSPMESSTGLRSVGSLDSFAHGDAAGGLGLHSAALMAAIGMEGIANTVEGALALPADPVRERCLALLLVLLHNRRAVGTGGTGKPNPFREVFGLLHDPTLRLGAGRGTGDDIEGGDRDGVSAGSGQELEEEGEFAGRSTGVNEAMLSSSRIAVSFRAVIDQLQRSLPEESTALLLYSLLQSHGSFVDVLTRSGSLPLVLAACLKGLYVLTAKSKEVASPKAPAAAPGGGGAAKELNQLYVLVVCVLILVQDGGVLRSLSKNRNIDLRWYAERPSDTASAVDACFLCILRCIVHSLLRLRDPYLLSNSCAILHNLSQQQLGGSMQPYTAERLVRVACQLCKRVAKKHNETLSGQTDSSGTSEWALLCEAVGTLLQVLDAALRPDRLQENVQTLYATMHDFMAVESAFSHEGVTAALSHQGLPAGLAAGIVSTARHYLTVVETAVGEDNMSKYSAAQTVALLRKELAKIIRSNQLGDPSGAVNGAGLPGAGMESGTTPSLGQSRPPKSRYTYQEAENAEEFFVPAIWTAAIRASPEIPWQLLNMTVLDPVAAGFVELRGTPAQQQDYVHGLDAASLDV